MFSVIAMQRFDFKNSIIAIKPYLVMILNMYFKVNLICASKGTSDAHLPQVGMIL